MVDDDARPEPFAGTPAAGRPRDPRQEALAIGLELARRATKVRTWDELKFILVNDTRALIPFDRSFLISHLGGVSELEAVNNQSMVEKKSEFVIRVRQLARSLRGADRALVIFADDLKIEGVSEEVRQALADYAAYSGNRCLMLVPLEVYDHVVGHLVLEFLGTEGPGQVETLTLMNMVPFLSAAVAEKWMLENRKGVRDSYFLAVATEQSEAARLALRKRRFMIAGAIALILLIVVFIPITLRVGGRAEAVPEHEYAAFVQLDGIVDKVLVKEGDFVRKDQVVAELEGKEIDFRIRESQRLLESYRAEAAILRNLGAENPQKLAESQLVAIKAQRAEQDLAFLNWQKQFLSVRSPLDGIVLTRKVETLIGKKFRAGEPFCSIAPHNLMLADVFVREADVPYIQVGQRGEMYFNFSPTQAYPIRVKSVAPKAETMPAAGGVFRVKADLLERPAELKPGMAGIAHIDTVSASVMFVLTRRIRTKLSELFLWF